MHNRIEICGAIASGKSSLTTAFSKLSSNLIFEDFTKVAWLDDFYSNPSLFSFETETAFTLQHYYQLKTENNLSEIAISDFSLIGDYAFALVTLNDREMPIYQQLFEYVLERLGKPQKLIRLSATMQTLLTRIKKRDRQNEQNISGDYLLDIERGIDKAIDLFYNDIPIVEINTDKYYITDYTPNFLKNLINI